MDARLDNLLRLDIYTRWCCQHYRFHAAKPCGSELSQLRTAGLARHITHLRLAYRGWSYEHVHMVLDTLARNACRSLAHCAVCDIRSGTSHSGAQTQCRVRLYQVGKLFWLEQSVHILQYGTDDTHLGFCW